MEAKTLGKPDAKAKAKADQKKLLAEKAKESIVKPIVAEIGKKHALELILSGPTEEMPELKSVGYTRVPGTNLFMSYIVTTKGDKVLKIEPGEPNMRQIAEDEAKINFIDSFSDEEF